MPPRWRSAPTPCATTWRRSACPGRCASSRGAGRWRWRPSSMRSTICAGALREGADAWDAIAATAAPVMVTGTPRAAALAAIAAHEAGPRGWYGGLVVEVRGDGAARVGTILRAATVRDGVAEVRTGGDLVAGSDPAREELESRVKAVSLWRALGLAVDADLEARVAGGAQRPTATTRSTLPAGGGAAGRRRSVRRRRRREPARRSASRSIRQPRRSSSPAATTRSRARSPRAIAASSRSAMPRRGCCEPLAARSSRRRRSTAGSSTACRSRERPRRRCGRSRPCATPPSRWPNRARPRPATRTRRCVVGLAARRGRRARRPRARRAAGGLFPDPARVAAERSSGARTPPCGDRLRRGPQFAHRSR